VRVEISPQIYPQRGGDVVVGNVYANNRPPAFRNFRIVVGMVGTVNGRTPWNRVVTIHVDGQGNVVGASHNPEQYVKNHWDLIGRVIKMPVMRIEWLHEGER
jgi:hypothetical protein